MVEYTTLSLFFQSFLFIYLLSSLFFFQKYETCRKEQNKAEFSSFCLISIKVFDY
ncbi:hypothetical protein JCM6292_3560 [Bacteroides pyogenes JCM 6292]|uniref:Uncharacterized protein n=1 Tax=Bacteroides pyogenes JCM 6292 TaxID=1235809 RepID=W4PB86_9BACE|nr:hypothetical protein JCM6292_3560 [Bacteroides pyogenes JCM 6292]